MVPLYRGWLTAGPALPAMVLCCGAATAGPVVISGDAADGHASPAAYAGLLQQLLSNTTNGQTGILVLGADLGSPAADWILALTAALPQPQPVAFVNDQTVLVIGFSGYAALYIPSDAASTPGGIDAVENGYLSLRAADIAQFVNAGGGLFGLAQGALPDPYAYLGTLAPVQAASVSGGQCAPEQPFDNVTATATGALVGLTSTGLDGCCWRNVFESFAPTLVSLAKANEPGCPEINGKAALLAGFTVLDFDDPSEFAAAGAATTETLRDLNGDGALDVVVAIPNANPSLPGSIQVFLNQGNNEGGDWLGLQANTPVTVGKAPSALAAGLFNADAHADLAVANAGDNTLSILLNDGSGNGTFLPASIVPVGQQPRALVAADFNRDTYVDLVVANELDQTFIVLLNDGDGNFGSPVVAPPGLGFGPIALSAGDFDGNKDPDITGGGSSAGAAGGAAGTVFVALSNGDGTFAAPVFYTVGADPRDLAVGDVDGDGKLDILSANRGDDTVSLLKNTGGSFAPAIPIPVGAQPTSVDAPDLDGDGDPDLAVAAIDPEAGPAVQVLVNSGGGGAALGASFQVPQAFTVDATPNWVSAGDLDGDGLPDVITSNTDDGGGSVSALLNAPGPLQAPGGVEAFVDVRPNGCPNPLNPASNGLLPVALVGSESFDVGEVDLDTLVLARADGVGLTIQPIGVGQEPVPHLPSHDPTPQFDVITAPFAGAPCACGAQGPDDILDLEFNFRTDKLVSRLQLAGLPHGTNVELLLTGQLFDGTPFAVSDCVVIAAPKTPPVLLSVSSNAPGVFIESTPGDEQLDEGGFAPFQRMFEPGTMVTLTAAPLDHGRVFLGWKLRSTASPIAGPGTLVPGSVLSIPVRNPQVSVQAVYLPLAPW